MADLRIVAGAPVRGLTTLARLREESELAALPPARLAQLLREAGSDVASEVGIGWEPWAQLYGETWGEVRGCETPETERYPIVRIVSAVVDGVEIDPSEVEVLGAARDRFRLRDRSRVGELRLEYVAGWPAPEAVGVWTAGEAVAAGVWRQAPGEEGAGLPVVFLALTAGVCGAVAPAWPATAGEVVVDGLPEEGVTWLAAQRLPEQLEGVAVRHVVHLASGAADRPADLVREGDRDGSLAYDPRQPARFTAGCLAVLRMYRVEA